jgi:hypothetical protein
MGDTIDLDARVARLEARNEIRNLMGAYARLTDTGGDPDEIAELFTEDGVYSSFGYLAGPGGTSTNESMVGRDAIRATFTALPGMLSFMAHYLCNPEIHVSEDGTSATGTWLVLELATAVTERTPIMMVAQYNNDFVRVDGAWKIKRIRFGDLRSFPFKEGWGNIRFVDFTSLELVTD